MIDTSRLKPLLQQTKLAHQNQPLFQLLSQLIDLETKIALIINASGSSGPIGPQGPQGVQGNNGINGIDGNDGSMGPPGLNGVQGPQGIIGPQGLDGDRENNDIINPFNISTPSVFGIGTIPSSAELDVGAPGPTETRVVIRSTGTGGNRIGASVAFQGYNSNTNFWTFFSGPGGGDAFSINKTGITNPYIYFNGSNSKIGVNTTDTITGFPDPFTRLVVAGTGGVGTGDTYIGIRNNNVATDAAMVYSDGTNTAYNGFMGGSSGGAGNWCIYASGIRFVVTQAGQIGIGSNTTPTAALHIKAGTATANTAPLKLTSGTLLTSPEAGAIEFLTDAYYATITTGPTRKTFAFREDVAVTQASGKSDAQNAAVASITTFTVGASNALFLVAANVDVTVSTVHNFTCTVSYTDETNTARVLTLNFSQLTGAFVTAITNVTGAGPYEGVPLLIRAKAATAITIATTGTFTTVTYNVAAFINQVALT